jgi:hypothetical protein
MKYDENGMPIQTTVNPDSVDLEINTTQSHPAAGPWQDGPPPKDGMTIFALFENNPMIVVWHQMGICNLGSYEWGGKWRIINTDICLEGEPDKWAPINLPEE